MLSKLRGHVHRNVVGYIALFFALTGSAAAAAAVLHAGDPAGGDLTGTYPNPTIGANKVDSAKVNDGSLTAADVNSNNKDGAPGAFSLRTLGNGPQQAAAGNDPRLSDARTPTGAAGGDLSGTYPNPSLANGSVTTSKFAANAQAPDSAKLDGLDPSEYGGVMSGRVDGLTTAPLGVDAGPPTGSSAAAPDNGAGFAVATLSPDHRLIARDIVFDLTSPPGPGKERRMFLLVDGSGLTCAIQDNDTSCTTGGGEVVPPRSRIEVAEQVGSTGAAAADLLFGFRMVPDTLP